MKLLMFTATINNWSNCTMLCVKKGRIIGKDMTSWFSSTTTHHRTRQQWSKITWRYWKVLPHPAYSPVLAPSDYHLFSSMSHALAERYFDSYEDVRKWLEFASKDEEFFWRGIYKLLERWEKCIVSEGKYFE